VRIDAGADLRIRPIAAGECDINQDLARARTWFGQVRHDELFRPARCVNHDGLQGPLLFAAMKRCAARAALNERSEPTDKA
jgi:hypothetical protein